MIQKSGPLRGEKYRYTDGEGCCVWYPHPEMSEQMGYCFDFPVADIDAMIELLQTLKTCEPEQIEKEAIE